MMQPTLENDSILKQYNQTNSSDQSTISQEQQHLNNANKEATQVDLKSSAQMQITQQSINGPQKDSRTNKKFEKGEQFNSLIMDADDDKVFMSDEEDCASDQQTKYGGKLYNNSVQQQRQNEQKLTNKAQEVNTISRTRKNERINDKIQQQQLILNEKPEQMSNLTNIAPQQIKTNQQLISQNISPIKNNSNNLIQPNFSDQQITNSQAYNNFVKNIATTVSVSLKYMEILCTQGLYANLFSKGSEFQIVLVEESYNKEENIKVQFATSFELLKLVLLYRDRKEKRIQKGIQQANESLRSLSNMSIISNGAQKTITNANQAIVNQPNAVEQQKISRLQNQLRYHMLQQEKIQSMLKAAQIAQTPPNQNQSKSGCQNQKIIYNNAMPNNYSQQIEQKDQDVKPKRKHIRVNDIDYMKQMKEQKQDQNKYEKVKRKHRRTRLEPEF